MLLLDFQASAVSKNWTGATSLDWNTASNWSPSGVPGPGDDVTLFNVTNAPRIINGTTVTINDLEMKNGSTLTVDQGASLNVIRTSANTKRYSLLEMATIYNHGTIVMRKTKIGSEIRPGGFSFFGQVQIHNHASMDIQVPGEAIVYFMPSTGIFTNYGTGRVTLDSEIDIQYYDQGQFINRGMLISKGRYGAYITTSSGSFTNYGVVQMSGEFMSGGTVLNQPCGIMVVGSVSATLGSFTNSGFVYMAGPLNAQSTRFTNNGLAKYGSLNGAYTNNHVGITDHADPIFSLGPQVNEIIEGIYLDQDVTERAGTYTQSTNTFAPNPDLPPGPITLYVQVEPTVGGCSHTIPFGYTVKPLPVRLISFSGKKGLEDQNQLKWVTSDEKDFDRFDVERSVDAKFFETIGSVRGAVKGGALQTYSFDDTYAKGDAYYRLKMMDTDRTFTYSSIIYVGSGMHDADQSAILGPFYPNPALGGATAVDLFTTEAGRWTVSVLDPSGKVMRRESKVMQKGMNKIGVDQLPEGLHLVRFENEKKTMIRKLVSQ
ncbi:T9SS type A sorting domain-containing protein [Dyadobacter sp. LHD-138]|uniref:T9SS type A sorting domain-containing protein n=1 Tax=Dyadobacter sp. LHD-138 TaxID=3071413 RepID=UPI0027E19F78|nr:T9SS type A sorting domain-containing protein [Dyadobacter sp. LHD-138]MDQ6477216.1 T9SS type A sorting domain-containing protein [Dyadobacter sp. LHD-138]